MCVCAKKKEKKRGKTGGAVIQCSTARWQSILADKPESQCERPFIAE